MNIYEELYEVMHFSHVIDKSVLRLSSTVRPHIDEAIVDKVRSDFKCGVLTMFTEHYSQSEAKEIVDFYQSDLGLKVRQVSDDMAEPIGRLLIEVINRHLSGDGKPDPSGASLTWKRS